MRPPPLRVTHAIEPIAVGALRTAAFVDLVQPRVWAAADRPHFVEDTQAMRRRVEDNVPSKDAERQLKLELTDAAMTAIAEAGFDPAFGARPLKRAIQRELENPLSKAILQGKFGPKDVVEVEVAGSELGFRKAA